MASIIPATSLSLPEMAGISSGDSYLRLVVIKIRVALKEELEKNEWKIQVADDQRIVIERLLSDEMIDDVDVDDGVIIGGESLLESADRFNSPEMDDIDYGIDIDLINDHHHPVDIDSNDDLFMALTHVTEATTTTTTFDDQNNDYEPNNTNNPSPTSVPNKRKRGRPRKYQPEADSLDGKTTRLADSSFSCCFCDKRFRKLTLLDAHVTKKHSSATPLATTTTIAEKLETDSLCNTCGISFRSKKLLKRHFEKAHEVKTWSCKFCGKSFKNGKHARRHELSVHLGKTKLNCPTCQKEFSSKENLGRHMQTIHEGKKVLCEICGKGFTAAHSMKIHVELVHMQKRVPCNFCGKEMSEVHLQRHIRSIHQGVRYKCEFCEKSFDRTYRLKKHVENVHQRNPVKNHHNNDDDVDDHEDDDDPVDENLLDDVIGVGPDDDDDVEFPDDVDEDAILNGDDCDSTTAWLNIPVAESLEIVGTEEDFLKIPI